MSAVADIDDLVADYMRTHQVPGVALGIQGDDRTLLRAGYGTCSRNGEPVTPRTLFHLASVTKTVVAAAVMQLVERGAMDLDAPFIQYVPSFKIADPRGADITTRQLLTHTSGLPDAASYNWDCPEFDDQALDRYIASMTPLRLLAAPGERFSYSDTGFDILGALIASVTGLSAETYIARHILVPLAMQSSSLLLRAVDQKRLAAPHVLDEQGVPVPCAVFPYNRRHACSSTLYSNVDDMLRWAGANLQGGKLDGQRILREETHASMWVPAVGPVHPSILRNGHIGLSWFIFNRKNIRIVGHMGQDDGFASLLLLAPARNVAIISMANRSYDYAQAGLWELQFKLLDRLCP